MATHPAIFRFQIDNGASPSTTIERTHPVPAFLCNPTPSQQTSAQFHTALLDILTVVAAEHHAECMNALTSPCVSCAKPALDALKSPINCLHLMEPMMIMQIAAWCGEKSCDGRVRQYLIERQNGMVRESEQGMREMYGDMNCDVCGKEGAKRCAGCGKVAYCGVECQRVAWKGHKRECRRRNLKPMPQREDGLFETI